jgi:enoyl-CoA hydratase/carnithine racemase
MSDLLLVEREAPIVWLTLNRPDVLNSLNRALLNALLETCSQLSEDKETRVVIITGAGTKAFCAGADLAERKGMTEGEVLDYLSLIQKTMRAVETLPQVTIAAVNGGAFGGGTELTLCCDLRIMAQEATMRLTEVKLGIIPGAGGTQRLPRLIGKSKAKELILTARPVNGREAQEMGLVHRVIQAGTPGNGEYREEFIAQTRLWAKEIASAAPLSLKQAKWAIDNGFDRDLEAGLALETKAYLQLVNTKDRLEGLAAFAEKRPPVYRGE